MSRIIIVAAIVLLSCLIGCVSSSEAPWVGKYLAKDTGCDISECCCTYDTVTITQSHIMKDYYNIRSKIHGKCPLHLPYLVWMIRKPTVDPYHYTGPFANDKNSQLILTKDGEMITNIWSTNPKCSGSIHRIHATEAEVDSSEDGNMSRLMQAKHELLDSRPKTSVNVHVTVQE